MQQRRFRADISCARDRRIAILSTTWQTVTLMAQNHMAEGVLCRPLKSQLPHMSTDLGFVDGMKWGLSFMINNTPAPTGNQEANAIRNGKLLGTTDAARQEELLKLAKDIYK